MNIPYDWTGVANPINLNVTGENVALQFFYYKNDNYFKFFLQNAEPTYMSMYSIEITFPEESCTGNTVTVNPMWVNSEIWGDSSAN